MGYIHDTRNICLIPFNIWLAITRVDWKIIQIQMQTNKYNVIIHLCLAVRALKANYVRQMEQNRSDRLIGFWLRSSICLQHLTLNAEKIKCNRSIVYVIIRSVFVAGYCDCCCCCSFCCCCGFFCLIFFFFFAIKFVIASCLSVGRLA